jgi:hypothetical protein
MTHVLCVQERVNVEESRRKHAEDDYANVIKLNTQLQESLSQKTTDVASFKLILSEKESELQSLKNELSQRTVQVSLLESCAEESKRQAEEASRSVQQQLDSLRADIAHKEEEVAKMRHTLETTQGDMEKLRETEEAARVALTADMEVIANSTSCSTLAHTHIPLRPSDIYIMPLCNHSSNFTLPKSLFLAQLLMQQPESWCTSDTPNSRVIVRTTQPLTGETKV